MLEELDSRDITEYLADYAIEPWGEVREDIQAGIVASTIANVNRGRDTPAYKPGDFMPDWTGEKKRETLEEKIKRVMLKGK